ncbi:MAG: FlgD immunoglobulin-like domain containing protein, partial [Bacteroidota bacterium]
PNPVSENATVRITFEKPMMAEVQIADINGKIIRTLQTMQMMPAGDHIFIWNRMNDAGSLCANGTYRLILRGAHGINTLPVIIAE